MSAPQDAEAPAQELSLREYVRPLVVRWWIVVGLIVSVTIATYIYFHRQSPSYSTSTRIFISAGNDNPTQGLIPQPTDRTTSNQATLLTSGGVRARVAARLNTDVGQVGGVSAAPSEGSDFIDVSATNGNPKRAAQLANAYASEFVAIRASDRRRGLLTSLSQQRAQLDALGRSPADASTRAAIQATITQLRTALATPSGIATQLDPAGVPSVPTSPKPKRDAIFAAALALLAGIALAFGLERFDRRLKRVEDVEGTYDLPLLVVLPHGRDVKAVVDGGAALDDDFREAFRQLRTNIQLESLNQPIKRILVTSAVPGEGKSTVVRNLAIAYREFGLRVAVIDADLRRPTLGELFGSPTRRGLTTVMAGEDELAGSVQHIPVHATGLATLARIEKATNGKLVAESNGSASTTVDIASLSLLAAGPSPPNPQAVLSTRRMTAILDEMSEGHDIVIIDTPPVTVVSDALSLAGQVDAVLVVARLERTPKDAARRAVGLLRRVPGVNPIGVVANDITGSEAARYSYGYHSLDAPD